jgi:hypothetical protein
MAVIPHPPYSPDLAPCGFFLFPKMKLKLKGCRFDTIEEIPAELQRVLDTLTEKDFKQHSKNEGDGGTDVYMWEGTTLRVMAADRPYGEFYDFYSVSPEYFGYHLVHATVMNFVTWKHFLPDLLMVNDLTTFQQYDISDTYGI